MKAINVASVPQYSPFRYPGGKSWLIPTVRNWLRNIGTPDLFIEPFAGGASIGLAAAIEGLAAKVILIEKDEAVAAVWEAVLGGDAAWLADRICSFKMTRDAVDRELSKPCLFARERAFQTILRNRACRGGVMAPGAGMMRQGENGKGIASRWYPETLARRIKRIEEAKERIRFIHGDGLEAIFAHARNESAAFFIDPPYVAPGKGAGRRLYRCCDVDHKELFFLASSIRGEFLMTYEKTEAIADMAAKGGFDCVPVAMRNSHNAEMRELLVSNSAISLTLGGRNAA